MTVIIPEQIYKLESLDIIPSGAKKYDNNGILPKIQ